MSEKDDKLRKVSEEWREEAKKCKLEDGSLARFIEKLNAYEHDYSSIAEAVACAAMAGAYAVQNGPRGGLTGFQWGWASSRALLMMNYEHSELGICIRNLDDMLYPQYAYKFDGLRLDAEHAEKLKAIAAENLRTADPKYTHPNVVAWWKKLAAGDFPSWLRVEE